MVQEIHERGNRQWKSHLISGSPMVSRRTLLRDHPIEHSADDRAVEISRGNAKADNAVREYVHHDHDPKAPEQHRFAAKQVDAPQAVRGVPDHGEPRRAITTWQRSVVLDEYATHDILYERSHYSEESTASPPPS